MGIRGEEEALRVLGLPDQVVRLGTLFVLAGAALILARQRFVPQTFGEIGHYRAAATESAASKEIRYAGAMVCVECHSDLGEAKSRSYHRTLSCEVCHGPAANHPEDPEGHKPAIPRERGEACLYCHDYLPSRPTGFPQIVETQHNPMEPCIGCHDPHDPTPPAIPGSCTACHGQIARTKAVSHHGRLDCQTCHETPSGHLEAPRSYLPKKPVQREFCGGCHAQGAGSDADIPRVDLLSHGGTYLCWQCHYPHFPES